MATKLKLLLIWIVVLAASVQAAFIPNKYTTNGTPTLSLYQVDSLTNLDNDTFIRVQMGQEAGNVFSNYGRYSWTNTQAAIKAQKQWVLMLNQDGLSSIGIQSNFWHGSFTNFLPIAGVLLGFDFPLWQANVNVPNGGLFVPNQDPLFLSSWVLLGNVNSNVVYQGNVSNPVADFGVVYWVEESTAGHILIETNLGGGAYATVLGLGNVDCSGGAYSLGSGTMQARWATWTNPTPAAMSIRVTELDSGKSVKVLGAGWINRTITNGIIEANWTGIASCGWSNALTTNTSVIGNYLKFVNPKLILSEHITWDGGIDPGGSESYFQQFREMIRTNVPYADHVLTGVYPTDSTPTGSQSTNSYRQLTNAIYWGLGYFDGTSPLVDVGTMTNRGYSLASDIVHALPAGVGAYDTLLQYWLDLTSTPRPAIYPFWLSGQQPEFLYQIDTQPGGANAVGNKINTFLDLSGKGRDVVTFIGAVNPPLWTNNASVLNGRPWAWFQPGGVSGPLTRQMPTPIVQPFSLWAVVKADTIAGNAWLAATNTGSTTAMLLDDSFMGNGSQNINWSLNTGQWYIIETVWNGASSYYRINGGAAVSGNAGTISIFNLDIGTGADFGGHINGGEAFIGLYSGLPGTNFEAQMFSSLNAYYGVYGSSGLPFTYNNNWLTATNTRKVNIAQRGTFEVDFKFTDTVGGAPAMQVTVEDAAGNLTNTWVCSPPGGLANTSTNHSSFRVPPLGVVSCTNISSGSGSPNADFSTSRMTWE